MYINICLKVVKQTYGVILALDFLTLFSTSL